MRQQEIEELRRRAQKMTDDVTALVGGDGQRDRTVAARVALRRMVGRPPQNPAARAAHAYLSRHVRENDSPSVERAFYAVAAMIAAQPRDAREATDREVLEEGTGESNSDEQPTPADVPQRLAEVGGGAESSIEPANAEETESRETDTSLGVALGRATATDGWNFDPTERRLLLLCRQGLTGIHRQLPRLVDRLRADLVPVDWTELTVDLARWGADRDHVTKRWLQDFYRTHNKIVAAAKQKSAANGENSDTPNAEGNE